MNEYLEMWKNYANFTGRTTVRGYWMAVVFQILAVIVLSVLGALIRFPALTALYSLATLIPGLALTVRRLRDSGRYWAWIFISFVPVIGGIWLIVLLCMPSAAQISVEPEQSI